MKVIQFVLVEVLVLLFSGCAAHSKQLTSFGVASGYSSVETFVLDQNRTYLNLTTPEDVRKYHALEMSSPSSLYVDQLVEALGIAEKFGGCVGDIDSMQYLLVLDFRTIEGARLESFASDGKILVDMQNRSCRSAPKNLMDIFDIRTRKEE